MSTAMVEWFADLVAAAEERGFVVASVSAGQVELHDQLGRTEIVIRSVYVDGAYVRRILADVRRPKIENDPPLGAWLDEARR